MMMPGTKPWAKRFVTETWPEITAYSTMGTEGGMTTPMVPAAATRVCFQKHKSKKKLKKYAVSLLKPKGKQVVDVEYNL